MTQRVPRLAAGGGREAASRLSAAWSCGSSLARMPVARDVGLGGGRVAAQRRQPASVAGQDLVLGQPVGIGLGALVLGAVPVPEHQQRLDQVGDRERQVSLAPAGGRSWPLPAGRRARRRVGDPQVRPGSQRSSHWRLSPAWSASRALSRK